MRPFSLFPQSVKNLFLVVLLVEAFLLNAGAEEDTTPNASAIAHAALRVSPQGNWVFSAVLDTRTDSPTSDFPGTNPKPVLQPGEKLLTIEFTTMEDGSRQTTYRSDLEDGSVQGLRIVIPQDPQKTLRLIDLTEEAGIKDPQVAMLGSAFTFEDLSLQFLGWKNQEFIGHEPLKDRACWHIASYPSNTGGTSYSRVESWIDKEYGALLKALAYDAQGRIAKEFQVKSFQQIEGAWTLKKLELKAPLLHARSILEILDGKKE